MVANPGIFQLMFLGKNLNYDDSITISVGGEVLLPTKEVKLLGVTIDNKLTFSKIKIRYILFRVGLHSSYIYTTNLFQLVY